MEWRSEKTTSTTIIAVAIIGKYKETYTGKYYQQIETNSPQKNDVNLW